MGMHVTYHGMFKGRAKDGKGGLLWILEEQVWGMGGVGRVEEAGHRVKQVVGHCPCVAESCTWTLQLVLPCC